MILKNKAKIKSILDEVGHEDAGLYYVDDPSALYLYKNGCLFPSVLKGDVLSMHAAIPKQYRGQVAINSAKEVIQWALNNLNISKVIARVSKVRRNVNGFARLAGMKYCSSDSRYNYYEVA